MIRFFSPLKRTGSDSSRRFCAPLLWKNMWLFPDFRRVILPEPVTLKRFAAVLFVFIFGILLTSSRRLRQENHDHQLSVQSRRPFHYGDLRQLVSKAVHFSQPNLGMRDFPCAELTCYLNLVSLFKELGRVPQQGIEVVRGRSRSHLDSFQFLLFPFGFLLQLARFVFVLAVVDDLANGRNGGWGDHDEIETDLLGHVQGLSALKDSDLFSFWANYAKIAIAQAALVDRGALVGTGRSAESLYCTSPRWVDNRFMNPQYIVGCWNLSNQTQPQRQRVDFQPTTALRSTFALSPSEVKGRT